MKWVNKTNEKLYVSSINKKDTKFCIYGAGILGGDLYNLLKHYGMFSCFIDNNEKILLVTIGGSDFGKRIF